MKPAARVYQRVGEKNGENTAAAPRLARLLEEIVEWKKRVNLKLQQASQDRITREFLQELLLEIKAGRNSGAAVPVVPAAVTGAPTLHVTTTPTHPLAIYSVPDRTGRVLDYVAPQTKLDLYEPWTENESGVWMRTQNGGWFQLWNRSTKTYFAD